MSERAKAYLLFFLAWVFTMAFCAAMAWLFDQPSTAWTFFGAMAAIVTWTCTALASLLAGISILEDTQ